MEVLVVSDSISIKSSKGEYLVSFNCDILQNSERILDDNSHYLIDQNVANIYAGHLKSILKHKNSVLIESIEINKSIERIIPIYEKLVKNSFRRDHKLVAIGGGIIQDITCFIASTLHRGLSWSFVPTTLLAQADSCIGSKSSINLGNNKNIIGTFHPPSEVTICTGFLSSLRQEDILSGLGEILKVHAIESIEAFDRVANDYDRICIDHDTLLSYIKKSLSIKKYYIEKDEFDKGIRNIFNYGHSFGHAIEAVTNFSVPHGIAVSIGMDMANRIAVSRGLLSEKNYLRMHSVLKKNYEIFSRINLNVEDMLSALMKDKKNTSKNLVLIFPAGDRAALKREEVSPDKIFIDQCQQFINEMSL